VSTTRRRNRPQRSSNHGEGQTTSTATPKRVGGKGGGTKAEATTTDAQVLASLPIGADTAEAEEAAGSDVAITWGPNADSTKVAASALAVIKAICTTAGEDGCTITSTARDATDQARAMYNNLVATGVAAQRALYGPFGDQVIDTYEASKAAGKTADQIKADMAATITAVGPSNVSKHCADPTVLCVVDIAPSSITNKTAFVAAVEGHAGVSKFLQPPADPAYHLEIPV
jgi:hypothetical protein